MPEREDRKRKTDSRQHILDGYTENYQFFLLLLSAFDKKRVN